MQSLLQRSPSSNIAKVEPRRTHKQHTPVANHVAVVRRSLQAACQAPAALASTVELVQQRVHHQPEQQFQQNSIVAFSTHRRLEEPEQQPAVPLFVSLCDELCAACYRQPEAARGGLKALQRLGVWGVVVNIWWGQVESAPQQYDWAQYQALFQVAQEVGLRVKVSFCFHGDDKHTLPAWVLEEGKQCPDMFFTDRAGCRNTECLSVGVDHVPALAGRTALQAYTDFMAAFRDAFSELLGSVVTDADIGLGPRGEFRYPSTPLDSRWNFPGIGEFQCYDRFMVASLSAAAQQVGQPHWGNSGPHDAGSYCQWPHQTGFFHHQGSWDSEYGRFFLQWYSSLLLLHADQLLGRARQTLGDAGVRLHAKLPTIHWWYNQAAHAAELTAGLYNTGSRSGYLAFCQVLSRHRVGLVLTGGEMRDCEQPSYALASPEALLLQLRATAASQQVPVTLGNLSTRFDQAALSELERKSFEPACYRGIDLEHVDALCFGSMSESMFEETQNWLGFKDWAGRMREHNAALAAERQLRSRRPLAARGKQQQQQEQPPQQQQQLVAAEQQQEERQSALV